MTDSLPTIVTLNGLVPTPPATIRAELVANISSTNPGYTANLPGSLVEDILSTDVASVVEMESFRVDLVNSLDPFGVNAFLANQLGQVYGVPIGEASNTSVFVIGNSSTAGLVIGAGFIVSDGNHQYTIQDGGVVQTDGNSAPLFALANEQGTWAVPANSVTQNITSVPGNITLAFSNPEPGTPGAGGETEQSYRARVMQAGLASAQGMARFLKTQLQNIPNVQSRLVSIVQGNDGSWMVLCGGGDPYAIAYAIYIAMGPMLALLSPSVISVANITAAAQGNVTVDIDHGFTTGANITITGTTPGNYSGNWSNITVVGPHNFLIGNTSTFSSYVSGGVVTPNGRNIDVTINDYPDTYAVVYVNPLAQTVQIALTWNTTATNLVSDLAITQAGAQPLVDYINNLTTGNPINIFVMQDVFSAAIAALIPPALLTRMEWTVTIDGVITAPDSGTGIVEGDPQGFFSATLTDITITRG